MSFAAIKTGCVLDYSYLWARESDNDETEGRKPRPVAVGVRMPAKAVGGNDTVILFPITTKKPSTDVLNIEIPDAEKRGAGLDRDRRMWIVLEEYNLDVIGGYYLPPNGPIGLLGKAFFAKVLNLARASLSTARVVNRGA